MKITFILFVLITRISFGQESKLTVNELEKVLSYDLAELQQFMTNKLSYQLKNQKKNSNNTVALTYHGNQESEELKNAKVLFEGNFEKLVMLSLNSENPIVYNKIKTELEKSDTYQLVSSNASIIDYSSKDYSIRLETFIIIDKVIYGVTITKIN